MPVLNVYALFLSKESSLRALCILMDKHGPNGVAAGDVAMRAWRGRRYGCYNYGCDIEQKIDDRMVVQKITGDGDRNSG